MSWSPLPSALQGVLDLIPRARPAWLLTAACLLFVSISLIEMREDSCTMDEGLHLAAGYTYATRGDFRLNVEHPPLVKTLSAIPLLLRDAPFPNDSADWDRAAQGELAFKWLYQSGHDADRLLFLGRLPCLIWPLLLIVGVYAVSKDRFGPAAGLLSLMASAFCPLLLAHGHLVTTDVPLAALFFLTIIAFWKLIEERRLRWGLYLGMLLGGALAAKFSAVILIPILGWIGILGFWSERAAPDRARRLLRTTALLALAASLSYLTLWGCYGFRFSCSPDPAYRLAWEGETAIPGITGWALNAARNAHLLPEAYLKGYVAVQAHSALGQEAFACGRYFEAGRWWYFPFAFLVKTPVATLLLLGWGVLVWLRRARGPGLFDHVIMTPLVIYGVVSMGSRLNIGLRHLLPVFPLLFIIIGGILQATPTGHRPRIATGLAVITAVFVLLATPHHLAYFNLPSTLVAGKHRMLVDSNLDWGQDLTRLKKYLDCHSIPEVKLCYFGFGSPRHLGLRHRLIPGVNAYRWHEPEWDRSSPLRSGDIVAISATSLAWELDHERRADLTPLAGLDPIDSIGGSILIFRIP